MRRRLMSYTKLKLSPMDVEKKEKRMSNGTELLRQNQAR